VLGITSYVNSVGLSKARKQFDDLENRMVAIETKDGYSVTNSDGSVFVQEKSGTRRWYRSASDMPTNIISQEFCDGVRFGLLQKAQDPLQDNLWVITTEAHRLRSALTNWAEKNKP